MSAETPDFSNEPSEPRRRRRRRTSSSERSRRTETQSEELLELDEEATGQSESDSAAPASPSVPSWVNYAAATLPALLCWLGTGRQPWVWALVAGAVGLLLICFPQKGKLPLSVLLLLAAMSALCFLSVIPLPWPAWPDWRVPLEKDFGIMVGTAWSAMPWVTFELALQQLIMIAWFLWWVARPITPVERRGTMVFLAAALSSLAVVALVFRFTGYEPTWWNERNYLDFGPFANRNHFSGLMAISALLALSAGYELKRRKSTWWLPCALGVVPAFVCILLNTSRAGIVLFFLGIVGWFLTGSLKRGGIKRLAVGGALVLGGVAALTIVGKHVLERFRPQEGGVVSVASVFEGRSELYKEALRLASDHPGLGVGLGNFENVFSRFHTIDGDYLGYHHPESDLLWFLCEAGWPATVCVLLLIGILAKWTGPWLRKIKGEPRGERRFRITAALVVILALIHGIADTPNHGVAPLTLVLMMAGLALRQRRMASLTGVAAPHLLRALGLVSLLGAGLWAYTVAGHSTVLGHSTYTVQMNLAADTLYNSPRPAEALKHTQAATAAAPMLWPSYYMRGEALLQMNQPAAEALSEFAKVRYLEQHLSAVPLREGEVWLQYDPQYAIPAWREALRRSTGDQRSRYTEMCNYLTDYPELAPALRGLANNPTLLVYYIGVTYGRFPEQAKLAIEELAASHPSLQGLSEYERLQYLIYWAKIGDRADLTRRLDQNKDWLLVGWFIRAEELAREGKLAEAYRLAERYAELPRLTSPSRDLGELTRTFTFNPSDLATGTDLYSAQRSRNLNDDAMLTLDKLSALPTPPRFIEYERARIYSVKGDMVRAWEHMRKYISITVGY